MLLLDAPTKLRRLVIDIIVSEKLWYNEGVNTLEKFLGKYWWIILIIPLGIAVAIYILITPPPTEYTAYTIAKLIFDFLDKWASAGAPAMTLLAVAVALYMGIKSLRQTESIQKRDRKERLLNEIIEWATDVTRANFGGEVSITAGISGEIQKRQRNVNRLLTCQVLTVKGEELIEPIALSISKELSDAVKQVLDTINVVLAMLNAGEYTESKEAKGGLEANDAAREQNLRAIALIRETVRDELKANAAVLEQNLRALIRETAKYKVISPSGE